MSFTLQSTSVETGALLASIQEKASRLSQLADPTASSRQLKAHLPERPSQEVSPTKP